MILRIVKKISVFQSVPFSNEDEAIIFDKESRLNSLEDIVSRLEDSKEQYKEKKKEVTREKLTLKSYIAQIDANIDEAEKLSKIRKSLSQRQIRKSLNTCRILWILRRKFLPIKPHHLSI